MNKLLMLQVLISFLLLLQTSNTEKYNGIKEPDSYEPEVLPRNIHNARQLLGYDHFKLLSSKSPTKYPWESGPEIKYNFK